MKTAWPQTLLNLDDKADNARIQVQANDIDISIVRIDYAGNTVTDAIIVRHDMARKIALAILKEIDSPK